MPFESLGRPPDMEHPYLTTSTESKSPPSTGHMSLTRTTQPDRPVSEVSEEESEEEADLRNVYSVGLLNTPGYPSHAGEASRVPNTISDDAVTINERNKLIALENNRFDGTSEFDVIPHMFGDRVLVEALRNGHDPQVSR